MRAAAYVTAMLVMHLLSIDAPAALCISLPMLTKQSKDELQHHTHGYNARYYSKFLHREKHMVYMIIFVKCSSYYSLICRYLHICRIHNLLILLQHLYSSYKCKDPTGLTWNFLRYTACSRRDSAWKTVTNQDVSKFVRQASPNTTVVVFGLQCISTAMDMTNPQLQNLDATASSLWWVVPCRNTMIILCIDNNYVDPYYNNDCTHRHPPQHI